MRDIHWLAALMLLVVFVGGCAGTEEPSVSISITVPDTTISQPSTTREQAPTVTTTTSDLGETSSTGGGAETNTSNPAPSGSVELELSFFDWTEANPPSEEAFVVVEGAGSWTPDLEFGGDDHSFGDFAIGVPGTLLIYPDGPDGQEMSVTFIMTDEMISGSAQALTHVEVYDSEVLVYGQAIPDFEQIFDR